MTASIFDFVADELERRTDLATLEARGTVRLALKEAGLDARSVTVEQMVVMLRKVMPTEMRSRGVDQPEAVCGAVVKALQAAHPSTGSAGDSESPEAIFRRLAQS
jgi:hypothetical protein